MAQPRQLDRPPITEALIDLRAQSQLSPDDFKALGKELHQRFPKMQVMEGMRAELRVEQGKLIAPKSELLGFQGIQLTSADETLVVRFQPGGFTFHNLKSYVGGDRLIEDALTLWSHFSEKGRPGAVSRVGMRYINHLRISLQDGEFLSRYLVAIPELPESAPQRVSEFSARVVAHEDNSTAVIVRELRPGSAGAVLLIDIDVFQPGPSPSGHAELRGVLDSLRILKNRVFFSLLTEHTLAAYELRTNS